MRCMRCIGVGIWATRERPDIEDPVSAAYQAAAPQCPIESEHVAVAGWLRQRSRIGQYARRGAPESRGLCRLTGSGMRGRANTRAATGLWVVAAILLTAFAVCFTQPTAAGSGDTRSWALGALRLHPCEVDQADGGTTLAAWCTRIAVPENRAAPGARTIKLKLAVVRSEAINPRSDMVVLLAGGPGQAATASYRSEAAALEPLREHRHIVLLDQRGTGGSNALTCEPGAMPSDSPSATDPETIAKQTRACLKHNQTHADPRFYTTTDAVADLAALRRKLGAPTFDLIGISYGTRVAQQYAGRHPEGVRSMVLDGVVPNTQMLGRDMALDLDHAVGQIARACVLAPACHRRFGDPAATLGELRQTLAARPRTVSYRDPQDFRSRTRALDAETLVSVVRLLAYTSETAALMPLAIDRAAHGDAAPLMAQAELVKGQLNTSLTGGMAMSVLCSEDAAGLKPRAANKPTLLGNRLIAALKAQCRVWPHGRMPADFHRPLQSPIPTLLVSGARDPVTPPRFAAAVARHLTHARSVVLEGQGHNNIMRGCMPELIARFMDDLRSQQLAAGCLDRVRADTAFLDFNGAGP